MIYCGNQIHEAVAKEVLAAGIEDVATAVAKIAPKAVVATHAADGRTEVMTLAPGGIAIPLKDAVAGYLAAPAAVSPNKLSTAEYQAWRRQQRGRKS